MTDNDNRMLIYIPKDANYIEIFGHRIDGFHSFENFCEHLNKYAELEETVNHLQAENERLKNELDILLQKRFNIFERVEYVGKIKAETKTEAYKEFAERLKKTFPKDDFLRSTKRISEDIDNILKEKVGEYNV